MDSYDPSPKAENPIRTKHLYIISIIIYTIIIKKLKNYNYIKREQPTKI